MKLSSNEIIQLCLNEKTAFLNAISEIQHEIKGPMNSEMLLFCALSKYLNVSGAIESGRARGNSTEIIARYFENSPSVSVYSVEFLKYTSDSLIAMQRLYGRYSNLTLQYGNADFVLPRLCSSVDNCTVFIDGPKGLYAIKLAVYLLKNPKVKAVFIHDCHKGSETRDIIDKIFPNVFSTDQLDFVREFSDLDEQCWEVYKGWKGYEGWEPYKRGENKMKSYGPTLSMILNTQQGIDKEKDALEIIKLAPIMVKTGIIKRTLRSVAWAFPRNLSQFFYFFKYYAKLINYHL